MSMPETIQFECPKCHKESDYVMWHSVNTIENPETKSAVRDRSLFRFVCPECGAVTNIFYPFLYHQMEDKIMIHFVDNDEEADKAKEYYDNEMADGMKQDGYAIRIVTSFNRLLEKLQIFDAGLDDRIIEIFKVLFSGMLREDDPKNYKAFFTKGADEKNYVVFLDNNWKQFGSVEIKDEMYKDYKKRLVDKLPEFGMGEFQIDEKWARRFINQGHLVEMIEN